MSFLFQSTNFIIKILDKIFASQINIENIKNIPKGPVLFVANHFTRCETFILPYAIYKKTDRKVRSLADGNIFMGTLGKYLTSMGTISTEDPSRNEIIIGDLITGNKNWLIYPEGIMVKNKHVTKHMNNYRIHKDKCFRVKTGSATLAITASLLKKKMLSLKTDSEEYKTLSKKYFLNEHNISPDNISIVPVTIDYNSIRTGKSPLYNLALRFIKKVPSRIKEELEIEGNILHKAKINISFGDAIDVDQYVKQYQKRINKIPLLSEEIKRNTIINFCRHRLTNLFMKNIYDGVTITLEHIFTYSIFFYSKSNIDILTFKKIIYLNVQSIRRTKKYKLDTELNDHLYEIISQSNFIDDSAFTEILEFAVKQNILIKQDKTYFINKVKLRRKYPFHKVRIENSFKVFINELQKFPDLIKIFKKNSVAKCVNKLFPAEIINADRKEYFYDYKKYFVKDESHPQEQSAPFFLQHKKKAKTVIIMAHGYKSSPEEIRILAEYLYENNVDIYAIRLKGHGTAAHNMKDITWQDWYISFYKIYLALSEMYDNIIISGFSTGGLLSLLLASENLPKVKAIFSINAALRLHDIRFNFAKPMHYWNEFLDNFNSSYLKKEFVVDTPENPHINYKKNYVNGVKELSYLMTKCDKHLQNIKIPTMIIQAKNDPVVNYKSAQIIFDKIISKDKKIFLTNDNNHVIVREKSAFFEEIVLFIKNLE